MILRRRPCILQLLRFAVVWSVVISVLGAVVAAAVLEIEVSRGFAEVLAVPGFALSVHRWDAAPLIRHPCKMLQILSLMSPSLWWDACPKIN